MDSDGVIGLLSFLSFGFSVIAAVLAIDTYALLRTGQSGGTWRVLIIASVIFALMHALRLAEILNFSALGTLHLSELVELVFVMALAYAFYLQRRIFQGKTARTTRNDQEAEARDLTDLDERDDADRDEESDEESEREALSAHEWARLNGLSTSDFDSSRPTNAAGELAERRSAERRHTERRNSERRRLS